jgi:hypothetical protein
MSRRMLRDVHEELQERGLLELVERTAETHACTVAELLGRARYRRIATARHALWAELYDGSRYSYPQLGALFRVDPSSVRKGVMKVRAATCEHVMSPGTDGSATICGQALLNRRGERLPGLRTRVYFEPCEDLRALCDACVSTLRRYPQLWARIIAEARAA